MLVVVDYTCICKVFCDPAVASFCCVLHSPRSSTCKGNVELPCFKFCCHFIIAEFIELHRSSCCLLITLQRYEYFLNLQYIACIILYVVQNIRYIHILYIAIYSINMFYNIRILLCNILQIKRQYPDGGGCGFRVAGKSQMVTFIPHW